MRRFLVVLIPLLASVAAGPVLLEPHRAFACTIDPTYDPLRGADAVIYGHVDRIAHDWERAAAPYDPSILTIAIGKVLQGDQLPEFIEVHADVPLPNAPTMCPQFDRANLIARSGVFVIYRGADGSWSTNRMVTWFSDESPRSVPGEALSRMLGGSPADGLLESAAPLPPDTGSGTEPANPSAREIILLTGAGSIFLGVVLLAAIAAMAQPETPTRRR